MKGGTSWALTMEGLQMLIRHCPFLNCIEGLQNCQRLDSDLINEVKNEIKWHNFGLEIEG
jgi:hypothetical protein